MLQNIIIRCPRCGDMHVVTPRFGQIVAVYCLCQIEDTMGAHSPTRMEIVPVAEGVFEAEREPAPI